MPLIKERVTRVFGRNHIFAGIHVFTPSVDIPDEYGTGPRLVVLPLIGTFIRNQDSMAIRHAREILTKRGEQPRQKQNRLIFLAADNDVVARLYDQARTWLAWKSIVDDIDNEKLNLDLFQAKQARTHKDAAEQSIQQLVRETYKWLICPVEEFICGKPTLRWEAVSVSPSTPNLILEIENKLREEEWLIFEWSPVHLKNLLHTWYFKEDNHAVKVSKVWQDCCHYLYLPRLVNDQVFKNAINRGLETEDFFGSASGQDGERYLGFVFGRHSSIVLDEFSLLIEREAASRYKEHTVTPSAPEGGREKTDSDFSDRTNREHTRDGKAQRRSNPETSISAIKKHFYATVLLDPIRAKFDFAQIVDEVVEQFTAKLGVEVKITVEIQAQAKQGFDESLQRTVSENCNVLKFGAAEFEGGID